MACEMTVLPLPGGPYTNRDRPARIAGPSSSSTRLLRTSLLNAARTLAGETSLMAVRWKFSR